MSLFPRFFYKKAPDRLLEISERVYVFDSCLSSNVMRDDEYKLYLDGIVAQLQVYHQDASFMVFNFKDGDQRSQISDVLSQYDMTVMDYPRHYSNCPVLPLEMIHHFLRSSESWLSQQGQHDVLLMHCETSSWPVLALMLSGLLLYRKQYQGEQKTLDMVYKQAPIELLCLSSLVNPQGSQMRYLQYISTRDSGSDVWPPLETPLLLDCLVLRGLPNFEGRKVCRPVLRVYGQDPNPNANRSSPILLFSTQKHARLYQQEECILVKLNVQCRVQGDVVVECIHLHDDLVCEEIVFRIMFHTAFVCANILMVHRDEMDILWDAKNQFPKEFKAEVLFSSVDTLVPIITTSTISDDENDAYIITSPEDDSEVEEIYGDVIDEFDNKRYCDSFVVVDASSDGSEATSVLHSSQTATSPPSQGHSQTSQFPSLPSPPPLGGTKRGVAPPPPSIERATPPPMYVGAPALHPSPAPPLFRSSRPPPTPPPPFRSCGPPPPPPPPLFSPARSFPPPPDMMAAVLAMDDSVLDIDQIENLILLCPTEEEMSLLKNYTGDKTTLGQSEQYMLELMKVPRVESKLRVFSLKIYFSSQITEFKTSLNAVNSACEEVRTSQKLKHIMKRILYLGNTLNQGTARGAAVGFKLDSLLKLSDTRTPNSKMTLMHHLCKVLASKASVLLDFPKDLKSLVSASKIQLKSMAEEMQAIIKGLEKLNQELTASESDGLLSDIFRKTLKDFISIAEIEVATVSSLYDVVENNANQLAYYFGEDPKHCPFEQVTATLLNFITFFKRAHEENIKQAKLEKKKAVEAGELGAQPPPPPPPMYRAPPPPRPLPSSHITKPK